MASPPPRETPKEFGKRKPAAPPAESPPVKRSRHVALLMFGTMAVGGTAYALMPRQNCQPNSPGMAAPSTPGAVACAPRGSSSGGGYGSGGSWSRGSFFSGDSASPSSSTSTTSSGSTETTRGGFGGFARAFAAHFSGG
jgi:hypothetical protein